ncbi:MAG: integrase [Mesorhizobium sp.]|uniref:site-specific integrase n=1 Tax=Mesorhizobium sp. TaxID=1871066 RepID=UPI000FE83567|nr:tyrosine-type recombinase/integrase [Mesorhizobium sp.]RWI32970.1 MAG: integrase [Mesorhizobium sp.]RWI62506.1 MAG: integrase [Mesorhizobium sp.]RWI81273.1 MAG: integrase [Mesorhizobium sp.]RWJ41883.1 MAG: integrase [Mesorhizobium sp.]RWJ56915.1 MAG: integrase [Mesorhizobium sp.]
MDLRLPKPVADQKLRRAEALDALDSVLPFERRDVLAELLTDDDVATLRHLAKEGIGANCLRALASDLGYLEAWSLAATGFSLPWPAPEALLIKFVAHHLWDPAKRETDVSHGMPEDVSAALKSAKLLRVDGPHAPNTVRRRLSSWSTLTGWRGFVGNFSAPGLRSAMKLAVRASARPRGRKSKKAVTADVLVALLKACAGEKLVDVRDRALLITAFASGGRRRSEIASLRFEQIVEEAPVPTDPKAPDSLDKLPCLKIRLGRTKTTQADSDAFVLLVGRPVTVLQSWLERAGISEGAVFRGIDRWGNLEKRALTPQAVNLILKRRIAEAGFDPMAFSAHGLRSGYLTETARRGIPLPEAMQQSQHRSVQQASNYYNDAERTLGRAARIIV